MSVKSMVKGWQCEGCGVNRNTVNEVHRDCVCGNDTMMELVEVSNVLYWKHVWNGDNIIYRSGDGVVEFTFINIQDRRKHCSFKITIIGNDDFIFEGTDYSCPSYWTDQQIASDMFSWALAFVDYDLYENVVFDETIKDEDVVLCNIVMMCSLNKI